MKKILLTILTIFAMNGCTIVDYFEEKYSEKEFKSLCNRYELAICNEVTIPNYNNADEYEIKAVVYDSPFEYKKDDGEQYDYLSGDILKGDCEDWTITFIENNLRLGNFKRGQVEWIYGELNGIGHAWTIVQINEEDILFDNGYTFGVKLDKAYGELGYKEKHIIYNY